MFIWLGLIATCVVGGWMDDDGGGKTGSGGIGRLTEGVSAGRVEIGMCGG